MNQQGNRLKKHREGEFKLSNISVALFSESGDYISSSFGADYFQALHVTDGSLASGKYFVLVDPLWDEETAKESKNCLIDIYTPKDKVANFKIADMSTGLFLFQKALGTLAPTLEKSKSFYLKDKADYGESVYRITSLKALDCWYGFIYTQNNSEHTLTEDLYL